MAELVRLIRPSDGDIVNRHDGVSATAALLLNVEGVAPPGLAVTVSVQSEPGQPAESVAAQRQGERFTAQVRVRDCSSTITATCEAGSARSRILWDRDSIRRYRFSIDDNILFLKDIARGDYRSLFDHWYLGFWQDMHRRYGTKVHINLYYQTDESVFDGPPFTLMEMPVRFKSEWRENAHWLHLTFHARQNKPDRPYKASTYDEIAADYDAVTEQVHRFAGEEVSSSFTPGHWAEAPLPAVRALRDRGVVGLIGLFSQGAPDMPCRYYLDAQQGVHVANRDYWWDPEQDIRFVSCDQVVNSYRLDAVVPRLEQVAQSPHTSEVIELLIHEQYFRPELAIHQPDVQEKVVRAIEWVSDRGYKPVFYNEGFIGA